MTRDWIPVPAIVRVLLTLLIYVRLIKAKAREMRAGRVNMERHAIHLSINYIPNRRRAFPVGWWLLLFMTLYTLWALARRAAGL